MRKDRTCMFLGCDNFIGGGGRGLCSNHYASAWKQVKAGRVTWFELEARGYTLTSTRKNGFSHVLKKDKMENPYNYKNR